jgi:hypothetical protein
MKHTTNIALCLVATLAMSMVATSVVATAPASAEPASVVTVESHSKGLTGCWWDKHFCTEYSDLSICTIEESRMRCTGPFSYDTILGLGLSETERCSSEFSNYGEVKTVPLTLELGWINKAKGEVGLEERPTTGELYAHFICGPETGGGTLVRVKGGVIGTITPINKKILPGDSYTWVAVENKETGKQTVTKFEGGPTVEREVKIGAGAAFEAGPTNSEAKATAGVPFEVSTASGTPRFVPPPPHYYINSSASGLAAGEKIHVLTWGSLTLTPEGIAAAPTTCENAAGGFVENPEGPKTAAPGAGATEAFASWNCANAGCPPGEIEYPPTSGKKVQKEFIVFPGGKEYAKQSLPWPSTLTEPVIGTIRTESTGVLLDLACVAHGVSEQGGALGGDSDHDTPALLATPSVCFTVPGLAKQEPKTENGVQVGGPLTSKVTFDAGAGKLQCQTEVEGKKVEFKGSTEGTLHTMTYEGQELLLTK